jgi:HEAT repeat protein
MLRLLWTGTLIAAAAAAQAPSVTNAKMQTLPVTGGLETAVQRVTGNQPGPLWIGYAVPAIPGDRQACCWSNDHRGCGLEGQSGARTQATPGPVQLEGPSHIAVLLRVENRQVGKTRAFSLDCPLDAGGLSFVWLTGIQPSESVAYLAKNATDNEVHAIAMHAGPEADKALQTFAASGPNEKVRKSATFWLAISRGRAGYETVSRLARNDASDKIREHAIFALSQSKQPEAIPAIVAIAKEDRSAHVRGQALFWLAQKAAKQASAAITAAIESDPDTEVKKKAVFALTQMPKNEGVPMLIHVARTNANAAVRKQAMFWLGQSKDPRALRFFEEVLSK